MATKFIGHFKLDKSDNFEAFMTALGVNIALRKIGLLVSPEFTVEHLDGEHFLIKEWSKLKSHSWDFTLGQEFKDKTVDGREVMTTISFDGDHLVISEKPTVDSVKPVTYQWALENENQIHITIKLEDVVAHRYFKRLES